jgi:hypothetical protein
MLDQPVSIAIRVFQAVPTNSRLNAPRRKLTIAGNRAHVFCAVIVQSCSRLVHCAFHALSIATH